MINLLLIVSILVWPFGQLLSLTPFGTSFRLQTLDVLATLLFATLVISSHRKISKDPLFKPLAFFSLVAFLSLIVNFNSVTLTSLAYFLRFICYTSFYFAFRIEGIKKYYCYLFLAAAIFVGLGLLQYFLLPDVRLLRYLGFDDHYYRLVGSFFDPNFTGLVLALLVILSPWPYLLIPLIALGLTFSRASFLSLTIGLIYFSIIRRHLKFILAIAFLALLLFLLPKPFGEGVNLFRTFSIVSRWQNQKNALLLFVQKPILGHGFNTFKLVNDAEIPNLTSGVDNSFLFVLVTTGLAGLATFFYFLKTSFQQVNSPIVRSALVVILTHSLFNNSFFYSWILALFFLLVSLRVTKSTSP